MFFIAGVSILVIVYGVLWVRMISSPSERTGADFIVFFTAGRIAQTKGAANVYDPIQQQEVQQSEVPFPLVPGQVLLYNHVPYLIPILTVLISGNYVASFYRWVVLLVVIYIAAATILSVLLKQSVKEKSLVWFTMVGLVTFFPLFVSLLNGQDTAFAFLGLCLYLLGIMMKRDWLAGLGLAFTSIRPQFALLLAVPFIFRRQKAFGWFLLAGIFLGGISLLIVGLDGMRAFINLLLVSASGGWYGLNEPAMVNLVGLLWRVVPGLGANSIHLIGWGIFGVTLVYLCILWARSKNITEKEIGLAITLAVFVVPHLHYHDLTLLIVPIVLSLIFLLHNGNIDEQQAAIVPLALSLLFLFSYLFAVSKYNFPYVVMLCLVVSFYYPTVFFRKKKTIEYIDPAQP